MVNYYECSVLLARARELLIGREGVKGAADLKWDFAQTAMVRAAAVLAAAAVNHLADDLDERDAPGLTDEELDEALKDMDATSATPGNVQP